VSPRIEGVTWSVGASPEAMLAAFGEEAFTVAVLAALLEDPALKEKAEAALAGNPATLRAGRLTR